MYRRITKNNFDDHLGLGLGRRFFFTTNPEGKTKPENLLLSSYFHTLPLLFFVSPKIRKIIFLHKLTGFDLG